MDPSLDQAQLRFRLSQYLVAQEAAKLIEGLVAEAQPSSPACAAALRKALIAYTLSLIHI